MRLDHRLELPRSSEPSSQYEFEYTRDVGGSQARSLSIRWNVGARQRCAGDGSRGRVLRNRSNWRGSGRIGSELKNATFANPARFC